MKTNGPALLSFLLLAAAAPARADRDIVYAARYYAPPGSHGASHFHLYRINPDGTARTQITSGTGDEGGPRWSPDGTRIAFWRGGGVGVIAADGGPATALTRPDPAASEDYALRWSPDGRLLAVTRETWKPKPGVSILLVDTRTGRVVRRFADASDAAWSPDGQRLYVCGDRYDGGNGSDRIAGGDGSGGVAVAAGDRLRQPVWIDNDTVAGLAPFPTGRPSLRLLDGGGHALRRLPPRFPKRYAEEGEEGFVPFLGPDRTSPAPTPAPTLTYGINRHNSTVGADWLFLRLRPDTGAMTALAEGQFLAWSPDGARFCVAPGRDTTPYERRPHPLPPQPGDSAEDRVAETYRLVWAAPLFVRAAEGGPMRRLTPRLSYVTGADWRKAK